MENNRIKHILKTVAKDILERKDAPELPTGIRKLDDFIWGLKRKETVIIAGRTSHGKTALAMQIAWYVSNLKHRVAVFSLEMSKEAVAERFIAWNCKIISEDLERANLGETQREAIQNFVDGMDDIGLYVHDDTGFTFDTVEKYCKEHHPDLLVVDYVQMIRGSDEREALGVYTRAAKECAKMYNCAIILNAQANRKSVEGVKKPEAPRLENLKSSGVLEENPDVVLLVHYPHKYDAEADVNEYHIVIAKKRNGRTGTCVIQFIPEYYKFIG